MLLNTDLNYRVADMITMRASYSVLQGNKSFVIPSDKDLREEIKFPSVYDVLCLDDITGKGNLSQSSS